MSPATTNLAGRDDLGLPPTGRAVLHKTGASIHVELRQNQGA
jgi:hypothetical protein